MSPRTKLLHHTSYVENGKWLCCDNKKDHEGCVFGTVCYHPGGLVDEEDKAAHSDKVDEERQIIIKRERREGRSEDDAYTIAIQDLRSADVSAVYKRMWTCCCGDQSASGCQIGAYPSNK